MDLSVVYFPSAVVLGALHALEPGHAKTLTAAYLIGTKGTKRDATLLGVSVAFTHSLVVIGLSVAAVLLGREAFTDEASFYLAAGSSVLVIGLGAWLLRKRLKILKPASSRLVAPIHSHSHAPVPVPVLTHAGKGSVSIVNLLEGKKFRVELSSSHPDAALRIEIQRKNSIETHQLQRTAPGKSVFISLTTPAEPHEFEATLFIDAPTQNESISFRMSEPDHDHDHSHLDDDEHARLHAASLPNYVHRGERPTALQIVAFGAAGGLVPCPAAISVMLLSLSLSESGKGIFLVLGFSLGLALTLVGVGLLIVTGISKLSASGRLARFTYMAPAIAAAMVIFSGTVGLITALLHR